MSHDSHSHHHHRHSHGHRAGRRHSWHDERRRSSGGYDFEKDRMEFLQRRTPDVQSDRRRSSISSEAPSSSYERRGSMDSDHQSHRVGKRIVVVLPKPEPIQVILQQPPQQQPCQKVLKPVAPKVTPQPCQKIVPPPPPVTPPPPPCQAIIPPPPKPEPPPAPPKKKKEVATVGTGESMLQLEPVPPAPATVTQDQQTTMSLYPIIETYESVYLDAPMRPEDDPEPDPPFQLDEPGLCESCHKGYYVRKFTWSGIVAALFCFPCGIAVCFCSRVWVCNYCGEHPEHPKPELYDSAATIRKQASKATKAASKASRAATRAASKARSAQWRNRKNRVAPDNRAEEEF